MRGLETQDHAFDPPTAEQPLLDHDIDFLAPAEQPDEIGRLGGYRILKVLGVGGMGLVFRAEDPKLERLVALKVMKPTIAKSTSAKNRFLREAKATAALEHHNIVQIYQVGEDRGVPFIAMQYLRGESLQTRLSRDKQLGQREVLRIGREVAEGLQVAHDRGLIHRDIKPDNIWLDEKSGWAKILDFGLARATADDAGLTIAGTVLGTPRYMAPEQAQGQPIDYRCDLFSLGNVLYHLAAGQPAFDGSNLTATLIAVAQANPEPIESRVPDLHPEFAALIKRLLSKDREQRPQSAAEGSRAIAHIEKQLDAAPESPQVARSLRDRSSSTHEVTRPPSRQPPYIRIALALSAFAFLIACGVIIIKITNKGGTVTEIKVPEGSKIEIANESRTDNPVRQSSKANGDLKNMPDRIVRPTTAETSWHGWPADAPPPAIAPFNAEQAQQHQEAWAKYLGVPVEYTNTIGMKFRLIPPGAFTMGSTDADHSNFTHDLSMPVGKSVGEPPHTREGFLQSETPKHEVILTQPIYLGIHEVTQANYECVMMNNPSSFAPTGEWKQRDDGIDTANYPVETLSWTDAAEFCAKLSQLESLKPFYFRTGDTVTPLEGSGYALPTEAQWKFSCRAGTASKYCSGNEDEDLIPFGWITRNSGGRTHVVGELKANAFGLFDMHGNVWEWTQDVWGLTQYRRLAPATAVDPIGSKGGGTSHSIRGGSASFSSALCRSSTRWAFGGGGYTTVGFRVSLPVETVRQTLKLTSPALPNRPKASMTEGSTSSTAKPLPPLPPLDLDETDPLPGWELPAGAPPPVVAPCEPTLATERQQLWAEFLKRPVIEELDVAALALSGMALATGDAGATSVGEAPAASAVPLTNRSENGANASTLKFALIPPGEFRKIFTRPRDPAIEPDMSVRRFRITKPYALSTTEVTWDQFRQFVEATGYQTEAETNGLGGRNRDFQPDPNITWRTPGWPPAPNEPVTQVTPRDAEAFCAWLTDTVGQASSQFRSARRLADSFYRSWDAAPCA